MQLKMTFGKLFQKKWVQLFISAAVTGLVVFFLDHFAAQVYGYLRGANTIFRVISRVIFAFCVVALGYAAYRFKRSNQSWYGISEISFGFFSALATVWSVGDFATTNWVAIVGSTYVVARGVSNYWDYQSQGRLPTIETAIGQIPSVISACIELDKDLSRTAQLHEIFLLEKRLDGKVFKDYFDRLQAVVDLYGLDISEERSFLIYHVRLFMSAHISPRILPTEQEINRVFDGLKRSLKNLIADERSKLVIATPVS